MECLFCGRNFPSNRALNQHYWVHIQERQYLCQKCPKELISKYGLSQHLKTHAPRPEREVKCDLCGKIFLSKSELKRHVKNHDTNFECKICGRRFTNHVSFRRHEYIHKKLKTFACNICEKTFSIKSQLSRHEEGVHGRKRHGCPKCEKMFTQKSSLNKHLITHAQQRKRFQCDTCPKSFLNKTFYEEHQLIHRDQGYSFKCDKCDNRFLTLRRLKLHKIHFHLEKRKIIKCVFCEKEFPSFSTIQRHIPGHTFERPYFCKLCPAEFTGKALIFAHHKKVHCKIRELFKCELCPQSYLNKDTLNDHIRQHMGQLPFKCQSPRCGKRFALNQYRRLHFLRIHVGKQFSCSLCEKKFLRKSDLKAHAIVHTNFSGHPCDQCGSSFKWKSNLNHHKRTVHAFRI